MEERWALMDGEQERSIRNQDTEEEQVWLEQVKGEIQKQHSSQNFMDMIILEKKE